MTLRLLFDERQANKDLVQEENIPRNVSSAGWSMDTWFQKRLRYVREQQKKKLQRVTLFINAPWGWLRFDYPMTGNREIG